MQSTTAAHNLQRWDAPKHAVLAIARILLASYFLAKAAAFVLDPSKPILLSAWLPEVTAMMITIGFFALTGAALMSGKSVRFAALCLTLMVAAEALVQLETTALYDPSTIFWRDMIVLGALLLVAVTHAEETLEQTGTRTAFARVEPAVTRHQHEDAANPNAFATSDWHKETDSTDADSDVTNIFVDASAEPASLKVAI